MMTNTKVAGTTFHQIPEGQYLRIKQQYDLEGTPCADADAILVPEPTNQYDPDAVMVMVPLENGQPFHVGYLPKDSDLKQMVKKALPATVMVKDFGAKNPQYSASWIITEVKGL